MSKIYFFEEGSNGFYSNVIFDTEEGRTIERAEKSVYALDYHPYGLQGKLEIFQGNKVDCFKKLYQELTEKANKLDIGNVLIAFDENGWWINRPIWKISVRYQFLMKKN